MHVITDDTDEKFVSEYCGEYAIALHEHLGLPIYVLRGHYAWGDSSIGYVFVSPDGGRTGICAQGFVSINELKATCLFAQKPRRMTVNQISQENLAWELDIVENEILAEARQRVSIEYDALFNAKTSSIRRVQGS